jgi:CDP-diacylglycerol--glycerol-3-phosphate 3-phosphatidyltransferase
MAKIFSVSWKAAAARAMDPLARGLLRARVTPNAVTVAGTVGVVFGAWLATQGRVWLVVAVFWITLCALTDVLDGAMARMVGKPGRFGALLDSTTDRIADGAVFAAVAYLMAVDRDLPSLVAALIALVAGQVVSYVKARAEGLGLRCDIGLIERFERLVILGLGGLATGFGLGWGLPVALWLLAALSVFTAGQRIWYVRRQDQSP